VLTRNISWWGNQSLNENVFLSHREIHISKWAKPRNPFLRDFFLSHRVKAASGGNHRFFLC
jgi:hypothetical protein